MKSIEAGKNTGRSQNRSAAVDVRKDIRAAKPVHRTKNKKRSSKKVVLTVILIIVAVLAGAGIFAAVKGKEYYGAAQMMISKAEELKKGLNEVVDNVKKGNYEAADESIKKVDRISAELRTELSDPKWEIVPKVYPEAGEDMANVGKLLDIVDEASNTLMKPGVKYLREKGLPKKSTFSKEMLFSQEFPAKLTEYADLIDELCPAAEKVIKDFESLPQFNIDKLEKKVSKYRQLLNENKAEITVYLNFAETLSKDCLRPVAAELTGKDLSLGKGKLTDKIGPELASKLTLYADLIDKLTPIAEKTLDEINALPPLKIKEIESKLTKYRELAKHEDIKRLFVLLKEVPSEVLRPTAEIMNKTPFSALKTADGIDTRVIRTYLDLVEKLKPYIIKVNSDIREIGLLQKYPDLYKKVISKLDKAMPLLDEFEAYKPLVDVVLGNGGNKTYVVVALNTAEIRACGGFPGSAGTVTIKNGILKIGDFSAYADSIAFRGTSLIAATDLEKKLFLKDRFGLRLTCAVDNPHFPRAAEILAKGYKKKKGIKPDGVIAMTPHIIGKLIGITEPVKLSNGLTLDDKYSVKYIQRDIYWQYLYGVRGEKRKANKELTDKLFAEVAKKTISNVMSNLSVDGVRDMLNVVKESGEKRQFYIWMADSKAQKTVKELGLSGSLNDDPKKPEIGVFYTIQDANKLGIYVDLDVKYGEGKKNSNGTITYPVTVTLKNSIDKESLKKGTGDAYLTNTNPQRGAWMKSSIHFFAPAGGTISNFKASSNASTPKTATYLNLKLYYCSWFYLKPGKTATFTYNVTTAKGVTELPKIVKTPTLTEYRNVKAPEQ